MKRKNPNGSFNLPGFRRDHPESDYRRGPSSSLPGWRCAPPILRAVIVPHASETGASAHSSQVHATRRLNAD